MGRLGVKSTLRKCTIQKMGNFGMETGEDWGESRPLSVLFYWYCEYFNSVDSGWVGACAI